MRKIIAALLLGMFAMTSCLVDPPERLDGDVQIRGYAQKGQLTKGSQVTAFEIDQEMKATGRSFPANISDDLGSFTIDANVNAPYLEIRAEGYYFNEVTGENSEAPIYLEAIVPSTHTDVNINLFTTLTKPRIKRLLREGQAYSTAVGNAQEELLTALGESIETDDFTDIDITDTNSSDAILLAYACIIQQNRSMSQIASLIQNAALELESAGRLSDEMVDALKAGKQDVNPFEVIRNIAGYYTAKRISGRSVPAFHKHLDERYNAEFVIDDQFQVEIFNPTLLNYQAVNRGYDILSDIDFEVCCNEKYVSIRKEHLLGSMYTVSVSIPENTTSEARTATVTFVDPSGRELARREFSQDANLQVVELTIGGGTRSAATILSRMATFEQGDEIGVNDTFCKLKVESSDKALALLPREESYFFSYPAGSVSRDGHIARIKVHFDEQVDAQTPIPYYAGLEGFHDMGIPNPASVSLKPATALLGIEAEGFDAIGSIVIAGKSDDDRLSGTFSYIPDFYNTMIFYPELNQEIIKGEGREIRLNHHDQSGVFYTPMPPVILEQGMIAKIYASDGSLLDTVEVNNALWFDVGKLYRLRIRRSNDTKTHSLAIGSLSDTNDFTTL
ncbi:MAG: hypothetical protein J6K81_06845 [Rikenellaceae bacterium]|nr:hypothetical protein [Rikenellaceae bacterium]